MKVSAIETTRNTLCGDDRLNVIVLLALEIYIEDTTYLYVGPGARA